MTGLLLCECNGAIKLDLKAIADKIKSEAGDIKVKIANAVCIDEKVYEEFKDSEKLIIAACSPQWHERTFKNFAKKYGIKNVYIVNIREHVSYVHENGTEKAKAQIMAMVKKAESSKLIVGEEKPKERKSVVIIGSGIAGLSAALELEKLGFKCYIVEKESEIGGVLKNVPIVYPYNKSGKEIINEIKSKLENTEIITNAEVFSVTGSIGNFDISVMRRIEDLVEVRSIKAGAVVLATGVEEWKPYDIVEYGYGKYKNIITQLELAQMLKNGDIDANTVVMQLCVGSRDEKFFSYCSKRCCIYSIDHAIMLREKGKDVYVVYMDIRTVWKSEEELFRKARELGVKFIRGKIVDVFEENGKLNLTLEDTLEQRIKTLNADMLVLSSALKAPETNTVLAQLFDVETNEYGFFKKFYPKLRVVETRKRGIYLAGATSEPKSIVEAVLEAKAVAKKIATELKASFERARASIDEDRCIGCEICYKLCPHRAITMYSAGEISKAKVSEESCRACGTCVANCPTGAAQLPGYSTKEMLTYIEELMKANVDPKVATFVCYECAYAALDVAGMNREKYPENYLIIPVPCLGRVGLLDIFKAFESGASGVLLVGCLDNGCHYGRGNKNAEMLVELAKAILEGIGLEKDRIDIIKVVNADYKKFVEKANSFIEKIKELPKMEVKV